MSRGSGPVVEVAVLTPRKVYLRSRGLVAGTYLGRPVSGGGVRRGWRGPAPLGRCDVEGRVRFGPLKRMGSCTGWSECSRGLC